MRISKKKKKKKKKIIIIIIINIKSTFNVPTSADPVGFPKGSNESYYRTYSTFSDRQA